MGKTPVGEVLIPAVVTMQGSVGDKFMSFVRELSKAAGRASGHPHKKARQFAWLCVAFSCAIATSFGEHARRTAEMQSAREEQLRGSLMYSKRQVLEVGGVREEACVGGGMWVKRR